MRKQVKKVAFVANTSWSIYNFRLGIIKKLISLGVKVVIVAPEDDYSLKLVHLGCEFFDIQFDNYGTNPFKDIRSTIELFRLYRVIRPDFIFHYTIKPNIQGTIAAFLCQIPSIAITTGIGHLFLKNKMIAFISSLAYRLVGSWSQEVWFLNQADRDFFIEQRMIKTRKAFLLHSEGVNTTYFSPVQVKKKSNKLVFLYAGRITKEKGIYELIEAAKYLLKEHDNIEFRLLGFVDENNPKSISMSEIKDWETQGIISYLGKHEDIRPFIANADCLLLPSYREGMSRVLMEAAAMGKPIIASDVPGCRGIVENEVNGFLCEVGSVNALKETLSFFLNLNYRKQEYMGYLGRRKALKEFDETFIIEVYLDKLGLKKVHLPVLQPSEWV